MLQFLKYLLNERTVDIMAKNYSWRIKRKYFNLINKGIKTLEVRVGYHDIKRVQKGDTITFNEYSNTKFEVIRITRYENFPDMLDNEDSSKAIPDVTKYKALEMYQEMYPEKKEALGVYVFELQKQENDMRICTLSSLTNNHKLFAKFAYNAYADTDCLCKDYTKHFEWYWTKEIPRIFNGTSEVIVCTIKTNIAGVAFLKKDSTESKICTLLIVDEYREKHVATVLLKHAFKYLGTTKPLITIADYRLPMFEHIIQKYDWKLTQTLSEGYYNNSSCELVYNGYLSV